MDARHEQQDELNAQVRKNNPWFVESVSKMSTIGFQGPAMWSTGGENVTIYLNAINAINLRCQGRIIM